MKNVCVEIYKILQPVNIKVLFVEMVLSKIILKIAIFAIKEFFVHNYLKQSRKYNKGK